MAVADTAVKRSPPTPPPQIAVAVLAFVRFVLDLAPMLGLVRVARVAARPLAYLCLAIAWVISAGSAATAVALRVCREGSAPLVFLEAFTDAAFKFSVGVIILLLALAVVLLCGLCLVSLAAVASGSGSEFKKSLGAVTRESTQILLLKFPRAVFLGLVADLAFVLLSVAGILVMSMSSNGEGSMSQGEMIGSVIVDVGIFGISGISCFVIIPALAMLIWRLDQLDIKAGIPVADC